MLPKRFKGKIYGVCTFSEHLGLHLFDLFTPSRKPNVTVCI